MYTGGIARDHAKNEWGGLHFLGAGRLWIEKGLFPQKARKGAAVLAAKAPLGIAMCYFVEDWNSRLVDLKFGHYTKRIVRLVSGPHRRGPKTRARGLARGTIYRVPTGSLRT